MRAEGFTLLEVVVSIAILSVGLMAIALFTSDTLVSGTRARYMNMANVLASDKLDNLNKWPSTDPNVACTSATCGSLTGPSACASGDIYCDTVVVSEAGGADYETQTQKIGTPPTASTTTIVHTKTGCVDTPANCGVGNPPAGGATFTRRWLITPNPTISSAGGATTVTGARRITVLVTLNDTSFKPPVTFQMSMVRP
jgi:prepilin-type N-terminal cleavage/methylation domain-containing protein